MTWLPVVLALQGKPSSHSPSTSQLPLLIDSLSALFCCPKLRPPWFAGERPLPKVSWPFSAFDNEAIQKQTSPRVRSVSSQMQISTAASKPVCRERCVPSDIQVCPCRQKQGRGEERRLERLGAIEDHALGHLKFTTALPQSAWLSSKFEKCQKF